MLRNLTRATLAAAAIVAAALSLPASADTAAPVDAPRVEYRYFGQGAYVLVTPAPAPYALTGRQRDNGYWDRQSVRTIDVGQGRVIIAPTR